MLVLALLTYAPPCATAAQTEPRIERRPAQSYVAVRSQVTMMGLGVAIPKGIGQVFGWLANHNVTPAGPPFTRYRVIDMARELDIEVGVPVAKPVSASSPVHSGTFPAGRYATYTYVGNYRGLVEANAKLLFWASSRGIKLDRKESKKGTIWGARAEYFLTGPGKERDSNKQRTEIVYLVAGHG